MASENKVHTSEEPIPKLDDEDIIFMFDVPSEVVYKEEIHKLEKTHKDYAYFMEDLNEVYNNLRNDEVKLHPSSFRVNQNCAVSIERTWYRATITRKPINGLVEVTLVDESKQGTVKKENIKYLMDTFNY